MPLVAIPLVAIPLIDMALVAIPLVIISLIIGLISICLTLVRLTTNGRRSSLRNWRCRCRCWCWCHCSVILSKGLSTRLHLVGVNAWSTTWWSITLAGLLPPIVIDIFEIKRVYMPRQVSKKRQAYIDDQIYSASVYFPSPFIMSNVTNKLTHSTSCYSPCAERRD